MTTEYSHLPATESTGTESASEVHCDVLVVGSGAAGMAAALKAADGGLSVIVAEKEKFFGGTTAISAGWSWVPGNPASAATGDSREEQLEYLKNLSPDTFNAEGVTQFLDNVPEAITFFETRTAVQFSYPEMAPDYQMDLPGAKLGGRAILPKDTDARQLGTYRLKMQPYLSSYTVFGYMPQVGPDLYQFVHVNQSWRSFFYVGLKLARTWWDAFWFRRPIKRTNGNALMTLMVRSALDCGVTLWNSTPAVELLKSDGRVTGARLGGEHPLVVRARVGVVLAAGGFSGDKELRQQYFSHDRAGDQHFSPTVGHGGDAARLAIAAGGSIDNSASSVGSWAPVTVFRYLRSGKERLFPHLRQIGLPGLIAVDKHGKRFGNEALSYHDFGRRIIDHFAGQDDVRAYLIADAKAMHKYGIGYAKPWPMPRGYFHRIGYLTKGRTVAELATKLGIDPEGLVDTILEFNRGAAIGEDPQFGRGSTEYNHFRGDPDHKPNPNLAELDKGPYYAAEIRMGDLGTFAGIAVTADNRVIDANGAPIPGLLAVGAAAASIFGGGYPGYGSHIGAALVNGYRAGRDIASFAAAGNEQGFASSA